jgi:hypothetical protein
LVPKLFVSLWEWFRASRKILHIKDIRFVRVWHESVFSVTYEASHWLSFSKKTESGVHRFNIVLRNKNIAHDILKNMI